jgi:hypothetical protein
MALCGIDKGRFLSNKRFGIVIPNKFPQRQDTIGFERVTTKVYHTFIGSRCSKDKSGVLLWVDLASEFDLKWSISRGTVALENPRPPRRDLPFHNACPWNGLVESTIVMNTNHS